MLSVCPTIAKAEESIIQENDTVTEETVETAEETTETTSLTTTAETEETIMTYTTEGIHDTFDIVENSDTFSTFTDYDNSRKILGYVGDCDDILLVHPTDTVIASVESSDTSIASVSYDGKTIVTQWSSIIGTEYDNPDEMFAETTTLECLAVGEVTITMTLTNGEQFSRNVVVEEAHVTTTTVSTTEDPNMTTTIFLLGL